MVIAGYTSELQKMNGVLLCHDLELQKSIIILQCLENPKDLHDLIHRSEGELTLLNPLCCPEPPKIDLAGVGTEMKNVIHKGELEASVFFCPLLTSSNISRKTPYKRHGVAQVSLLKGI